MKKALLVLFVLLLILFLWWTISPLFINHEVADELPETTDISLSETFPIIDTPAHPATGVVRVAKTADSTIVRFENYDGTNGPDLRIYLAKDIKASEFIDLGPAKGNQGNINYDVPESINLEEYPYVLTWCKAFGVLFDYAKIQ